MDEAIAVKPRTWVAGHRGMLGSALLRRLEAENTSLISATREELDLEDQAAVGRWVEANRPDHIYVAAATVGGILANRDRPADFVFGNLMIAANIIHAAHKAGVKKLIYVASSAIYPRDAQQPISEGALLTGPLDPAHEPYATAKIAGIMLCRSYRRQFGNEFISVVPTNLYGPQDNFDHQSSHVLPALIRRAHEARAAQASELEIWGTGKPLREFLHVDDLAEACVLMMQQPTREDVFNAGSGREISVRELTELVCRTVGYRGRIVHDLEKPDGTPRKLLDCSRLRALGWTPRIELEAGVKATYQWYLNHA